MVDGCRSKLVNVVSGVPQGSVFGPKLFLLYTAEIFSIVENKLYSYADDSTLVAVVLSHGERVAVSESMNRDRNRVSVRSNLWGMFSLVFEFTSTSVFLPYRAEFSVCTCSCTVGKRKYHSV